MHYLAALFQDIRFALRLLRKSPAFTAIAVLTIALGIGANTAIFSVVNAVLLKPLPYPEADRVLLVFENWRDQAGNVSVGNFADWKAQSGVFDRMSATQISTFNLEANHSPERIAGERVSADFFETFRIQPVLGRFFSADENQPGREQEAVLSEKLWRSRFSADPSILQQKIQIDGKPSTVIGIAPASFDPVANDDQLWVPAAFTAERLAQHDEHYLYVFGRLKDGISQAQAQSALDIVARRDQALYPNDDTERGVLLMRVSDALVGDVRPILWMLLGAVGLVLLIACANVANLQLARARARRREIAIRRALGASGWRVVRQILAESLVLSILGTLAGVLLAQWGTRWLILLSPAGIPRIEEARLDLPTLGFAAVLAILSGLIFGLIPARRSASSSLNDAFKEQAGTITAAASRDHVRNAIVVCQIALALMLLVSAGLVTHSIWLLQKVEPGFDPQGVLVGRISLPEQFTDPERLKLSFENIVEKVKSVPGVRAVAAVSTAPLRGGNSNGLVPEGRPMEPASAINSRFRLVTPEYFSTMRVNLKKGRLFTNHDERNAPKVMVINETLARNAFPGQDPLGKRFACCEGNPPIWHEVIGVVGDVHAWGMEQNVLPEFYLPLKQAPASSWNWLQNTMDVVVRTQGDPASLTPELRQSVAAVVADTPVYQVSTMNGDIALSQGQQRFNTFLLGLFASVALLLAAVGIYGVLSYSVAQRTHEIGVRMALGATRQNVMRLVFRDGLKIIALGLIAGVAGAVLATRLLESLLFAVKPLDLLSFIAGTLVLFAVSLLASYVPARRATKVDPMVALRCE